MGNTRPMNRIMVTTAMIRQTVISLMLPLLPHFAKSFPLAPPFRQSHLPVIIEYSEFYRQFIWSIRRGFANRAENTDTIPQFFPGIYKMLFLAYDGINSIFQEGSS